MALAASAVILALLGCTNFHEDADRFFVVDSRRLSKPLTNELLGLHTARRGDYRVLFNLDVEDHILYVHRIEHRSDVYKPR